MTTEQNIYRRVLRRETHSSRSGAAVFVAVVLVLAVAAVGTVSVYFVFHAPAAAHTAFDELSSFRDAVRYPVLIGGVIAAVLGIVAIVLGVTPGRRPRRPLGSERSAAVVDDNVIASVLAARAASATGVSPDQLRVVVARHQATVRVVPTSGRSVDAEAVADAMTRDAAVYRLTRPAKVIVADRGVVG